MDLPLQHHVFSSVSGYKTLYASRDMAKGLREDLDHFARRVYKRVTGPPIHGLFRFEDGGVCWTKVFRNGADHVGRSRTCVHSIAVGADRIRGIPYFNPLAIDEPEFLQDDSDLQVVGALLRPVHAVPTAPDGPPDPAAAVDGPRPAVECLLQAILSVSREIVIRDPHQVAYGLLRRLSSLLPPFARDRFSVVRGPQIPIMDHCKQVHVHLIPADEDLNGYVRKRKFIVLDFSNPEAPNDCGTLPPRPNRYFDLIHEELLQNVRMEREKEAGKQRVRHMMVFLERHAQALNPTDDVYVHLVKGFKRIEEFLSDEATIDEKRLQAVSPAGIDAVLPLWHAGLPHLALELILRHCTIGRSVVPDAMLKEWEAKVRALDDRLHGNGLDERQREKMTRFVQLLTDEIARSFKGGGADPVVADADPTVDDILLSIDSGTPELDLDLAAMAEIAAGAAGPSGDAGKAAGRSKSVGPTPVPNGPVPEASEVDDATVDDLNLIRSAKTRILPAPPGGLDGDAASPKNEEPDGDD